MVTDNKSVSSQSSIRPGDDSDYSLLPYFISMRYGRNPVFALEMIQTERRIYGEKFRKQSQSSIRPGDDSDESMNIDELKDVLSRNPVFALEMIQTVMEPR